ncbi:MBL fold metallo-hydrolase [Methanobacterium sp.]|uniref:MBL fold metallo-hydrolase n=1 Tax=Methanobacterium sp. TaxID=2164 RepID=UPI003C72FF35
MKVTDDVYALDATKGNYAYLIIGKEIVLVDTGRPGQGKGILKELESMNINPQDIKHILLTHHDVDHIGNIALLEKETGAKIWASKEDIPYIRGEKNREGIKRLVSIIMRVKKPENINSYPENQKICNIRIIPTPGHTPGHVCLIYKDVLFAGDLIRTSNGQVGPMMSFMNWNTDLSSKSIKKVDNLSFKWVCPAHGEPIERNDKW